jgi:L-Lysine epsilon oxidase N-terminal/L-lysine epsilon oxidase C-terminal domain
MVHHLLGAGSPHPDRGVDCAGDPIASLTEMFVNIVEAGRIARGQCPALRPVFLKTHGIVSGVFRIRPDLPSDLQVGVFAGREYPAWIRFSSDTLPTLNDYLSTVGIAIKLFGVPGAKILGEPSATTFDFILQNMDVFFVNTARDMCEFTQAGVIGGDYGPYLAAHPETARILNDMAKPVASVLATPYWSGLPFAFGGDRFVKYKLEPTIVAPLPSTPPSNPTYLAADLVERLKAGEVTFRFCAQFRTNPEREPLDMATVPWSESISPPVHLADLVLPQQDVTARGQAQYGENLSWNIWRVTEDHRPHGSIADARRAVYAASAQKRRDANGVPTGEPATPKPTPDLARCVDSVIVRAAIHPAIGIARVGDSETEYYIGPQVTEPPLALPGFYRDPTGALKRQAALFRIYGYNAAGAVVSELTADNADIVWTAHLANRKAQWYQFQLALDIPDAAGQSMPRRNPDVSVQERESLAIDPGLRTIKGKSVSGGPEHAFDTGKFKSTIVPLGEIRTDADGRLLVLGGLGKSASPSGAPIYKSDDPNSFNNANDWYDDISDGPITATVSINGQAVPVEHAWVVVAPPNYGTSVIGWRTMYDLLVDTYVQCGWLPMPQTVSFAEDILPFLRRLSNLQWVNKGFAAMFGKDGPMDFENPAFVARLAKAPEAAQRNTPADTWAELRRSIMNAFRPFKSPSYEPRLWPWLYGDAFGSSTATSPRNVLDLPAVQQVMLQRWAEGDFVNDWDPAKSLPKSIDEVPVAARPAMLDKAALHFCLADAFHPGCEMTWPVRHTSMFEKPFRFRLRPAREPEPDYGSSLTPAIALQPGGPLYDQIPGSISRWMALPWQGDTAFCRSGYPPGFDPYVPSFWPARVPNQVLTEDDYKIVMDTAKPRDVRLAALNNRLWWTRGLPTDAVEAMMHMVAHFADMGVVEARDGIQFDPDFPAIIYVESIPPRRVEALRVHVTTLLAAERPAPPTPAQLAGWESEAHRDAFTRVRIRFRE